jgi:hypothetical protein
MCCCHICRLDGTYTARQYWNYLRRQLYVLDTYSSAHNRVLNRTVMAVHCWAGAVLVVALLLAGAAVGSCVAGVATPAMVGCWTADGTDGGGSSSSSNNSSNSSSDVGGGSSVLEPLLALVQQLLSSTSGLFVDGASGSSGVDMAAPQQFVDLAVRQAAAAHMPAARAAVLLCLAAAAVALQYMVRQVSALLLYLHPHDADLAVRLSRYSCARMWFGLLVECVVSPGCMFHAQQLTRLHPKTPRPAHC